MFLCSLNEVQEVPSLEAFKMGKHAIHLHSTGVTQVSTTFDSEPHHSPHPLHLINPSSSLLRALQERHTAQPQLYCQSIKIFNAQSHHSCFAPTTENKEHKYH